MFHFSRSLPPWVILVWPQEWYSYLLPPSSSPHVQLDSPPLYRYIASGWAHCCPIWLARSRSQRKSLFQVTLPCLTHRCMKRGGYRGSQRNIICLSSYHSDVVRSSIEQWKNWKLQPQIAFKNSSKTHTFLSAEIGSKNQTSNHFIGI